MPRSSVVLFAMSLALLVVSCPAPTAGPDGGVDEEDVDEEDVDDEDACALGQRSRGPSESCCLAFGTDACGANLFCAAFDGRTVPTCYVEHTRFDGEECNADTHCASDSCGDNGACRASPGQPCSRDTGCATFQGDVYICTSGVRDGDRCLVASSALGGVCTDDDGCDSGFCVEERCGSGADGADCVVDNDCSSTHCVANACASGDIGALCRDDDDCASDLVCNDGECLTRSLGDSCTADTDCASVFAGCFDGVCVSQALNGGCDSDAECGLNSCFDGTCAAACTDSVRCALLGLFGGVAQECREGICVEVASIGDACTADTDCAQDLFGNLCVNGTCRRPDGQGCADNAECASDLCDGVVRDRCVNLDGEAGRVCTVAADCRADEQCRPRSVDECVAP